MDKRLKIVAIVGVCGGIAIILCGVLAFLLAGNFVPEIEPGEGIYGIFALLGLFIFGFLIVFLLSSYVVFALAGIVTALALSQQINKVADAIAFPLASGLMACASVFSILLCYCILTDAFSLSDLATTLLAGVILLFLPGTLIACISGAVTWAVARKISPSIKA